MKPKSYLKEALLFAKHIYDRAVHFTGPFEECGECYAKCLRGDTLVHKKGCFFLKVEKFIKENEK
jgi:hypothetical protein